MTLASGPSGLTFRDALLNESAESCTTFSVSAKPKVGGFN